MVTQQEIADKLGISASLVSKVLNNRMGTTKATPELVEAIHRTAEELGYKQNQTAVALAKGRHGVIAVFLRRIGRPGSGLFESLSEGILAQARQRGQRLLMSYYSEDSEFWMLRSMADRGVVDGLIVGGLVREPILSEVLQIQNAGMPVVTACHRPISPLLSNVGTSHTRVMRLAVLHLIERGCRRIAHINGMDERFEGYLAALAERGMLVHEELIWSVPFCLTYEAGVQAVNHWLAEGVQFDAIAAQSDEQAAGALNTLLNRGFRVPEDVRITGVDNSPYCNYSIIPLSSVSLNLFQAGCQSVNMLMNIIERPNMKPANVSIQPALHTRMSSK